MVITRQQLNFPLLVPEYLLIEPNETEAKGKLDGFVNAMVAIRAEATNASARVKAAPYHPPNPHFDDIRAARELDLRWRKQQ